MNPELPNNLHLKAVDNAAFPSSYSFEDFRSGAKIGIVVCDSVSEDLLRMIQEVLHLTRGRTPEDVGRAMKMFDSIGYYLKLREESHPFGVPPKT